MQKHQI